MPAICGSLLFLMVIQTVRYIKTTRQILLFNFSHHKLTCFEYADGTNNIRINDSFLNVSKSFTDLQNYYYKVGDVYDDASGRPIAPDYPSGNVDIEANINESRIVGPKSGSVGISSIKAGDGVTGTTTISVETATKPYRSCSRYPDQS